MNLNDFHVLVDLEKKLFIDKIQVLPENWNNISGLKNLKSEKLEDLSWSGNVNLGWINIRSEKLKEYKSTKENLELNKNTFKELISKFKKEKISKSIEYRGIKFPTDEKTRYSLFIKKFSNEEKINFKSFNKYYTLTKDQINEIYDIMEKHIQKYFDWEMNVYSQIDQCNSLIDFLNITL